MQIQDHHHLPEFDHRSLLPTIGSSISDFAPSVFRGAPRTTDAAPQTGEDSNGTSGENCSGIDTLSKLLHDPALEHHTSKLVKDVDFTALMESSEGTGASMVGSHKLLIPDDHEKALGFQILLIDRIAESEQEAINIGHTYFYSGSSVISGIHSLNRQLIIPFVRDFKEYVMTHDTSTVRSTLPVGNKVFIAHGHDATEREKMARFLERIGLEAIILHEMPSQSLTVMEKFEKHAGQSGFAVILLTPDDIGGAANTSEQLARARQNVIFELGYFVGKLGRDRTCLMRKGNVEIPTDLHGVIYTDMDAGEGWKLKLAKELKAAGLTFDASKVWE